MSLLFFEATGTSHVTWRSRMPKALKMLRTTRSLCVPNFGLFACSKPIISRINNLFQVSPLTQALNYLRTNYFSMIFSFVINVMTGRRILNVWQEDGLIVWQEDGLNVRSGNTTVCNCQTLPLQGNWKKTQLPKTWILARRKTWKTWIVARESCVSSVFAILQICSHTTLDGE